MSTDVYVRVSCPKGQKTDSQRAELEAWLRLTGANFWFTDMLYDIEADREAFSRLSLKSGNNTRAGVWAFRA